MLQHTYIFKFILPDNQKEKLLIDKSLQEFLDKKQEFIIDENDKFIEIASSIAYYLKSFSNVQKFIEYISLISKYLIIYDLLLIIPLKEKGDIWLENLKLISFKSNAESDKEIKSFLKEIYQLNNFKIKNFSSLNDKLKNTFSEYNINPFKISSRGKCRGFLYILERELTNKDNLIQDRNINFLINLLSVGLENYWLIKTKKNHENVDREISIGAEIQSQLLPDYCPIIYGVDLAAHCRPALQLGGDYFDFMSLKTNVSNKRRQKGRWALVIGDVMGKGIPAGLLMTMLRGMLRAEVLTGLPPDRILYDLNQLAIYDLDQSHRFVTLFYSDFDPRTKKLRFSNAAHNPPLLWKNSEKKIIKLDTEGFVIGIQKDAQYECGEIQLNKGDVLLYYTDGITDASNSSGERFDENRLIEAFKGLCKKSLKSKEILNKIFKILDKFTGKEKDHQDDASIVVFRLE